MIKVGERVALNGSGRRGVVVDVFPSGSHVVIQLDDGEEVVRRPDQIAIERPSGAESIS